MGLKRFEVKIECVREQCDSLSRGERAKNGCGSEPKCAYIMYAYTLQREREMCLWDVLCSPVCRGLGRFLLLVTVTVCMALLRTGLAFCRLLALLWTGLAVLCEPLCWHSGVANAGASGVQGVGRRLRWSSGETRLSTQSLTPFTPTSSRGGYGMYGVC